MPWLEVSSDQYHLWQLPFPATCSVGLSCLDRRLDPSATLGRLARVPRGHLVLPVPLAPPTVREEAREAELEVVGEEEVAAAGAMAAGLGETVADRLHLEGWRGREREGGRERERGVERKRELMMMANSSFSSTQSHDSRTPSEPKQIKFLPARFQQL